MTTITIAGVDPALANVGLAKGKLDLDTMKFTLEEIHLVQTEKSKIKSTRTNIDDVERCKKLYNGVREFLVGVDVVAVEIPVGSQSSRASVSYGACCMLTASIDLPVIPVLPYEVKTVACDNKNATKEAMINWAITKYPDVPWFRAKSKNEHVADAIASIHAAVLTDSFKLLTNAYKALR